MHPRKARLVWLLVIVWTCYIFSFSLQPLEISREQSSRMQERLQPWVEYWEGTLGVELIPEDSFHRVVRKVAHFTLFMILGALVYWACLETGVIPGKAGWRVLMWVVLVATADEVIQTRIPGRSGELGDVFLDTAGGLVGMSLAYFLHLCGRRLGKVPGNE